MLSQLDCASLQGDQICCRLLESLKTTLKAQLCPLHWTELKFRFSGALLSCQTKPDSNSIDIQTYLTTLNIWQPLSVVRPVLAATTSRRARGGQCGAGRARRNPKIAWYVIDFLLLLVLLSFSPWVPLDSARFRTQQN